MSRADRSIPWRAVVMAALGAGGLYLLRQGLPRLLGTEVHTVSQSQRPRAVH